MASGTSLARRIVLQHVSAENGEFPRFSTRYQLFRATRAQHEERVLFATARRLTQQRTLRPRHRLLIALGIFVYRSAGIREDQPIDTLLGRPAGLGPAALIGPA
jgi:hypothetical protein